MLHNVYYKRFLVVFYYDCIDSLISCKIDFQSVLYDTLINDFVKDNMCVCPLLQ